jgi:hypothetical protein
MRYELYELNHRRLKRIFSESLPLITISNGSNFLDGISFHILKYDNFKMHLIPTYNLDEVQINKDFLDQLIAEDCTALIPFQNNNFYRIPELFKVIERPNLYIIEIKDEIFENWLLFNKNKKELILTLTDKLEFNTAMSGNILINLFIKLYINLQKKRKTPPINFFDSTSLYDLIEKSYVNLFYIRDKNDSDSILFHLNVIIDDTCYFLFSANSNDKSRSFSSNIHWNIIQWLNKKGIKNYSLGGGVSKNDGIERFKREIGGKEFPRSYMVYPKRMYIENNFFPSSLSVIKCSSLIKKIN